MLELTSDDGLATVGIEYSDASDPDGRQVWHYWIDVEGTRVIDGADLRSGAGGLGGSLAEGLASLVGFLSAWQEAMRYGTDESENRDLFSADVYNQVEPYIDGWSVETTAIEEG